jgi:hypothetical protein
MKQEIQTFLRLKWYQQIPAVLFAVVFCLPVFLVLSPIILIAYSLHCFEWACSGKKPDWSD